MSHRSSEVLSFFVPGRPTPQGSKRQVGDRMFEASSNLKDWRRAITLCARSALTTAHGHWPLTGPVFLFAQFRFSRPKHHYGTGRNAGKLKPSAPYYVTTAPDLDKLMRALGDGITDARVVFDDSLIVKQGIEKVYTQAVPGVHVVLYEISGFPANGKSQLEVPYGQQ